LIEVERRLRSLASSATLAVSRVEVHPRIALLLSVGRNPRIRKLESLTGHRFFVDPAAEGVPLDYLNVVQD
jgi:hypothetical protein